MSITLPRTAIAALLASTLLFAGCSDDGGDKDDKSDSGEPTSQTSDDGDDASTDAPDVADGELTELKGDEFYDTVLAAQQQAGTYKGTISTTSGGVTSTMTAEGDFIDDGMAAHTKSTPESAQQLESIAVRGVLYIKGDGLNLPEGKWLKIDPNDPANANNPLAAIMDVSDPRKFYGALAEPKKFALVGAEEIDGVKANHYRITIDSKTFAEHLELAPEIASFLPPELTYDMWVDSENRPVKVEQEYEIRGTKTSTVQTYGDYGTEVNIEAPADADTVTR